jgi:hypothetical protein
MGSQAYIYKTRHSWCPQSSPPGPLSAGGTPPTGGPPGLGAVDQSSFPPLLLLDGSGSATLLERPHTAQGPPHPGCGPTCPPGTPYKTCSKHRRTGPPTSLWPLPMAHALVQHQHHLVSTSIPPSALQMTVALVPDESDSLTISTSRPRGPTSTKQHQR